MTDQLTSDVPAAVQQLVERLQAESGTGATISLTPEGYSHARSQQKFKIVAVGKNLVLLCLVQAQGVEYTQLSTKRSGAVVRTTINLKVDASSQPQPTLS